MPAAVICPVDGSRLVLVTATNAAGDPIERWECPADTWQGPWYSGSVSGDNESIPETGRDKVSFDTLSSGAGAVAITGEVEVKNDTGNPLPVSSTTLASEVTLAHTKNRFAAGVRTPTAVQITGSGDNTIITPTAGKRLRVTWLGLSAPETGAEVLAICKFGAAGAAVYRWNLGVPGAFAHWETVEGGTDAPLIVNLSGARTVQVNVTHEEFS